MANGVIGQKPAAQLVREQLAAVQAGQDWRNVPTVQVMPTIPTTQDPTQAALFSAFAPWLVHDFGLPGSR